MNTKTVKSLKRALLVCAMVASMMLTPLLSVHADPLPPAQGNLTIHKTLGDGTTSVNGIRFNLFKVTIPGDGTMPIVGSGVIYKINGSTLEVYQGAASTPAQTFALTAAAPAYQVTAGSGSAAGRAVWTNLPQGVYLASEDLAHSNPTNAATNQAVTISSAHANFIVSVPMTNATGDDWITDVQVHPKNESLIVEKTVDVTTDNAVMVGDVVTYTIKASVPDDIATATAFKVIDELDEALTYDPSSLVVKGQPGGGVLAGVCYNVSVDANNKLTVSFTSIGFTILSNFSFVEVSFATTVNDKIYQKDGFAVDNEASMSFTNKDGVVFDSDTDGDGPTIHTAAIRVTKIDQNGVGLNGSLFRIATSESRARAGQYLKITANGVILDATDAGYATETNYLQISPANAASFVGLRDVVNGVYQSYYVVEIDAPDGYNLLTAPIKVTFDGSEYKHTYDLEVINSKGFTLPQTGGMGTMVFSIAGVVLIALATAVALTKKRNSNVA